jgi:tetratricopeptide (TPR) repeat protein
MHIIKKYIILIFVLGISINIIGQNAYLTGKINYEKGLYVQSVQDLDKYIAIRPNDKQAYFYRAKAKVALQQYESAIQDFSKLNTKKNHEADLFLARAYAGINNEQKATDYLKKYLKSRNKLPEEKIIDFPEFGNIADTQAWEDVWAQNWYSKKEILLQEAENELAAENYQRTETLLNEYVLKYKENPQAFYLKAKLSVIRKNDKEALAYIDKAIVLDKGNKEYLLTKAQAEFRLKKYKKSLDTYNKLYQKDSLNPNLFYGRSVVYAALNEFDLAKADINKYLLYYPGKEIGQERMAKINEASGDYMSAIRIYGKLIEENPGNSSYYKERANAYMATHTYKYAIRDYSMALDLYPRDAEIYFQKGNAHYQLREIQKACSAWKRAEKYGSQETSRLIYKHCR